MSVVRVLNEESTDSLDEEDVEMMLSTEFYDLLSIWFRERFESASERQPTSRSADDYLILHSPGLSWTGT